MMRLVTEISMDKHMIAALSWALGLALTGFLGLAMQVALLSDSGSAIGQALFVLSLAGLVYRGYRNGMFPRRSHRGEPAFGGVPRWILAAWGCLYFVLFEILVVGTEEPGYPSMSTLFPALFAGIGIGLTSLYRWRGLLLACLLPPLSFAVLNLDASPGLRWMGFLSGCVVWVILVLAVAPPRTGSDNRQ